MRGGTSASRPAKIVTAQHYDYTGPENHPGAESPIKFLKGVTYTIPAVSTTRFHVAYFTGPDHP